MVGGTAAPEQPLPRCFIEQNAGGHAGIQALDWPGTGNRDCTVGLPSQIVRDTIALVANEQRYRAGQIDEIGGLSTMHGGGPDLDARFAQPGKAIPFAHGQ